uniref:non-specific serine/threonine protein kinase n=2 Tax=Noccaea caerulescens TaxID=107243 RepID=A0A1J3FS84_NOCCA
MPSAPSPAAPVASRGDDLVETLPPPTIAVPPSLPFSALVGDYSPSESPSDGGFTPSDRELSPSPSESHSDGGFSPISPSDTPKVLLSPAPTPSPVGVSTGAVVGIVIGGVAVLVLVVLTLIYFLYKKKRRRDDEAPLAPKENKNEMLGGQQQQNESQMSDHEKTSLPLPEPPTPPQQPHPPTTPRPFMSSSSSSDLNYSDHPALPPPPPGIYQGTFGYEELARATNGFSEANLLGQGGFGYVFKGVLPNGKEIAVKMLKAGSAQGEREFQAEIDIISRVHHRHLVALVGYCVAGAQRLLVYEFVPNNTLEFHLHGKGQPPMEWSSRFKVAVGSAKGLSYLHENWNPKIIHRDIKAANILIDFSFEAKVADFGLAKIVPDTNTHVSTRVMGTFGYLAPEYAASGKLTEKSDVYSFGVILLELITGRRPCGANNAYADDSLVDWARPLLDQASEENNFEIVADTKLNSEYDREEMARMVACAAASVRHLARQRPSMDQVARVLDGSISSSELKEETRPASGT